MLEVPGYHRPAPPRPKGSARGDGGGGGRLPLGRGPTTAVVSGWWPLWSWATLPPDDCVCGAW